MPKSCWPTLRTWISSEPWVIRYRRWCREMRSNGMWRFRSVALGVRHVAPEAWAPYDTSARARVARAGSGGAMVLRFADCELDLDRVVLRRAGDEVRIEPQAFDLLAYLVAHRGTMVRKEQLLDDVWGDRFVSESALTTRIKAVRQAVGDNGNRQAIIRTVHGKGYEFVAAVESDDADGVASPAAPVAGLGIALAPLIGRDAQLAELIAALSHHRLITLVGPGGVGKTSLALELARSVAASYADGVHLIELVRVVNEEATAAAFATAIDVNLRRSSSIDDAIVDMLRPRCSLLLLDNCEHLVEPVAGLVTRILREAC